MKKLILILTVVTSFLTCSQSNKTKQTDIKMKEPILTSANYVETMLREVKRYPKEPVYQVYVKNSLCLYEVLVNDFPIGKLFDYSQKATPYDINSAILKSGNQKITLRIYPAPAEYSRSGDLLSPNASCDLEIVSVDNKDANFNSIPIAKFTLPTKVRMAGQNNNVEIPEFEGEGKKYYEITFEFDATVPYENEGWINGQDLKKLDQKKLQEATLKFYQSQWTLYNNKDIDKVFSYLFRKEKETTQASFDDIKSLEKIKAVYLKPFTINSFVLEPINNYTFKIYGNGKIISLQQNSTDTRLTSNSALWGKYKNENGSTIANFRNYYLYLPVGKKLEDGLEVIR